MLISYPYPNRCCPGFFCRERTDAVVILAIVVINALLGIYQEGKAEKALEALKQMASPTAKVIRNGHIEVVLRRAWCLEILSS